MTYLRDLLVGATGLREHDIVRIASSAPLRYKIYYIPKRNGGRRQIAQPAKDVKFLQRSFVEAFLSSMPVHSAATAYRRGLSIRDNAMPHAMSGPILKLDLKEFFPSIRARDWRNYCIESGILTDAGDIYLSERILFFKQPGLSELRLSIGAPSSPMLSNVIMREFDERVANAVSHDKVIYTRYADDMTFSGPRTGHLVNVKTQVARIIRQIKHPRLDLNDAKTTYITPKYHRVVTGLTISNDKKVTIGHEQKRRMHAGVHSAKIGKLSAEEFKALAGQIAYVNSVEPEFVDKLRARYGSDVVKFISQIAGTIE